MQNKTNSLNQIVPTFVSTLIPVFVSVFFAHTEGIAAPSMYCKDIFAPKIGAIQVIAPTHQDGGAQIHREAMIVAEVAADLGLATPPHQLNIVPSEQINILATTGGHAAPHWVDGAHVLGSIEGVQGVMEFVTKGCPTCRAFYSASTPDVEQRSIIMHVAGHNDMSATSKYQTVRPGDAVLASKQLALTLEKAYRENHREEVVLFFQFLQSLKWLQDFAFGTFESPEKLGPGKANSAINKPSPSSFWDSVQNATGGFLDNLLPGHDGVNKTISHQTQWKKTYSVLQALTGQFSEHAPEWQRSLMKLFEQRERMYPAIVQTKIMNEGWATLQQYILARHLPWTNSSDLVKYGQLLSAVVGGGISFENPYWLGLSGWMNLYEQYKERPEIQGLSEKEKDRKFIAWARPFYESKNDSEWARIALDQRWVEKNKFYLYRKTQQSEMDNTIPPDKQEYIVLSRNWKRIRNYIIHNYVDKKQWIAPNISIRNPENTPGIIYLRQENTEEGIPLDIASAAKTSFALAQIMQKPVSLEALFLIIEQSKDPYLKVITLTVNYSGQVQISSKQEDRSVTAYGSLALELQQEIENYKADLLGSFHEEMTESQLKKWTQLAMQTSDLNSRDALKIVDFAPHTSGAIREYIQLVEKRLRQAVENSLKGKSTSKLTRKGVALQTLPEIPQYRYIEQVIQMRDLNKPVGPVDRRNNYQDYDFDIDTNGTTIGQGPWLPGDKFGKKQPDGNGNGSGKGQGKGSGNGSGDGDGEGDGDGSPGGKGKGKGKGNGNGDDDGDGEGEGQGGGQGKGGSSNPYDLQIPLQLYGELLGEVLELPNIRRTKGKEHRDQTVRNGVIMKPYGNLEWDEIIIAAIEKARAIRRGKGLPFDSSVPVATLIKEALPLLEPSDYYVSGEKTIPLPDFEAVLVVNVDLTGSMSGDRIRLAKNFIYNVKALLGARYKAVHIIYVGFSDKAQVFSEKDIFSKFFGGGTNYTSAIELDKKIMDDYPNSQFNKYMMTIGDVETADSDAASYTEGLNELSADLQYAGLVVTNTHLNLTMVQKHVNLKANWPWVGVSKLSTDSDMFQALKDLFPH